MFAHSSSRSMSKKIFSAARLLTIAVSGVVLIGSIAQAADSSLSHTDTSFLKSAAQGGNTEVEASKVALEKSTNPDVKAFAQKMIDEHSKVGDTVKKLAGSKNVTVPDKPSLAQRAKIDVLSKFNGASFDQHYASMIGVSAHKNTIALFEKESAKGKDPDVTRFATETLPALKGHLAMANDLQAKVDAQK